MLEGDNMRKCQCILHLAVVPRFWLLELNAVGVGVYELHAGLHERSSLTVVGNQSAPSHRRGAPQGKSVWWSDICRGGPCK